jgi:hypothetical protein
MSLPNKVNYEWVRRPGSGVLQRVVRVHADGPYVKAHLSAFGAKLAMALFRRACRRCATVIRCRLAPVRWWHYAPAGPEEWGGPFVYRYNCDGRTVIAAVAQFHRGLWFTIFASSDPKIIDLFNKPESSKLPASVIARPGRFEAN